MATGQHPKIRQSAEDVARQREREVQSRGMVLFDQPVRGGRVIGRPGTGRAKKSRVIMP